MLKDFYYNPCPCGQPKDGKSALTVLAILSGQDLDVQQGLFKLTMKSNIVQAIVEVVVFTSDKVNPTIINPLTCIW